MWATSDTCQDLDWRDPEGDSCAVYAREGWCDAHWAQAPASGMATEVTAKQACCACGGGKGATRGANFLVPPPADVALVLPPPVQASSLVPAPPDAALVPPIPPVQAAPSVLPSVLEPAQQQQLAELPKVTLRPVSAPVQASQWKGKASQTLAAAPASSHVPCVPVDGKSLADKIADQENPADIPDLRRVLSGVHRKMSRREMQVSSREQNLADREARIQEREAASRNTSTLADHARKKVQRLNDQLLKREASAQDRATAAEQRANASETKLAEVTRKMKDTSEALKAAQQENRVMKDKLERAEKRLAIEEVEREAAVQAAKRAEQLHDQTSYPDNQQQVQQPPTKGAVTHEKAVAKSA